MAQQARDQAQAAWEQANAQRQRSDTAIRELSAVYHPFDLTTGAKRSAEQVREDIERRFAVIRQVAIAAGLSESSVTGIERAKDLVPAMVTTLDFVHRTIELRLESLALPESAHQAVIAHWIPALYLQEVAARADTAAERHVFKERAEELLAPLLEPYGPLSTLTDAQSQAAAPVAKECAQLFQRSSSRHRGPQWSALPGSPSSPPALRETTEGAHHRGELLLEAPGSHHGGRALLRAPAPRPVCLSGQAHAVPGPAVPSQTATRAGPIPAAALTRSRSGGRPIRSWASGRARVLSR